MKWRIPVQRTVAGVAEVEALTLAEAMVVVRTSDKELEHECFVGDVIVTACEDDVRRRYNGGKADAKNGLIPFNVDVNKHRYASVIVWAENREAAINAVDNMIDADDERIVYFDEEVEIVDSYEASEDLIEKYPNVWIEENRE